MPDEGGRTNGNIQPSETDIGKPVMGVGGGGGGCSGLSKENVIHRRQSHIWEMLKSSLLKSPFSLCFPSLTPYACIYMNFKIYYSKSCHCSLHNREYALHVHIFVLYRLFVNRMTLQLECSIDAEHYNITPREVLHLLGILPSSAG
jgi:hypothetical protein